MANKLALMSLIVTTIKQKKNNSCQCVANINQYAPKITNFHIIKDVDHEQPQPKKQLVHDLHLLNPFKLQPA